MLGPMQGSYKGFEGGPRVASFLILSVSYIGKIIVNIGGADSEP